MNFLQKSLTTVKKTLTNSIRKECTWLNGPPPSYGGRHIVTALPGIGKGPQMLKYVEEVFEAAHVPVDFEKVEEWNDAALSSIKRNRVALKGPVSNLTDSYSNATLRSNLDLYIYLIHFTTYPNIKSRMSALDIYLMRQNTEGEYTMLEYEPRPGIVESLKVITRKNSERFGRWAYEYAIEKGRKKITIVHKANILKLSDGLFLKTLLDIGKDYPQLTINDIIVDNCCSQMVAQPNIFDVILTPNLYGNIISSILSGLIGGPGLTSGKNYGKSCAIFEVAARQLALENENPVAMLNAAVDMLFYIKKDKYAHLISQAVYKTVVEDKIHTSDIGGNHPASEVIANIIFNIKEEFKNADRKECPQ